MKKPLEGKTILVVDDEEMLRELLQNVFGAEGAAVTVAANGTSAFELCRDHVYDALITDVRMPGGDGVQLIENLRAHLSVFPLLFVCSGFNDLAEGTASKLGIQKVFEKPFNLREMISEVRHLLTKT